MKATIIILLICCATPGFGVVDMCGGTITNLAPATDPFGAPNLTQLRNSTNALHRSAHTGNAAWAQTAASATSAISAATATTAGTATYASTAGTATMASSATYASTAGAASTATSAGNADTLDTFHATSFVKADGSVSMSGGLKFTGAAGKMYSVGIEPYVDAAGTAPDIDFHGHGMNVNQQYMTWNVGDTYFRGGTFSNTYSGSSYGVTMGGTYVRGSTFYSAGPSMPSVTGGPLYLQGGNSSAANGGPIYVNGGTGASANGPVSIGNTSSSVSIYGIATASASGRPVPYEQLVAATNTAKTTAHTLVHTHIYQVTLTRSTAEADPNVTFPYYTIAVKNLDGTAVSENFGFPVWLSTSAGGAPCSGAFVPYITGETDCTVIQTATQWRYITTGSDGDARITIDCDEETEAYLNAVIGDKVYSSERIEFLF